MKRNKFAIMMVTLVILFSTIICSASFNTNKSHIETSDENEYPSVNVYVRSNGEPIKNAIVIVVPKILHVFGNVFGTSFTEKEFFHELLSAPIKIFVTPRIKFTNSNGKAFIEYPFPSLFKYDDRIPVDLIVTKPGYETKQLPVGITCDTEDKTFEI